MKKIIFACILICISLGAIAQQSTSLTVKIQPKKKYSEGQIIFMVFDKADGFPRDVKKASYIGKVPLTEGEMSYTFRELPYGKYAVSVFLDKDMDGEIDTNFVGFPKEPVGASNMKGMGRPTFEKCQILVQEDQMRLELSFINE